jgi:hypothetical protein
VDADVSGLPYLKDKWSITAADKACIDGTTALGKKDPKRPLSFLKILYPAFKLVITPKKMAAYLAKREP